MRNWAKALCAGALCFAMSAVSPFSFAGDKKHAPQDSHNVPVKAKEAHGAPAKSETLSKPANDMEATQDRLNALIKAAVQHEVVNKDASAHAEPKVPAFRRKKTARVLEEAHGICVAEEIYEFPEVVQVADYGALEEIKNTIITGPAQIDKHRARQLVLAYLGLGFGEEAQNFTGYLTGDEKQVLYAMGRAVGGRVREADLKVLETQSACYPKAAFWLRFAKTQYIDSATHADDGHIDAGNLKLDTHGVADADEHNEMSVSTSATLSIEELKHIKELPQNLGHIVAQRFGLRAIEHGHVETATELLKYMKKSNHVDKDGIFFNGSFDDETQFFEAMHMLEQGDQRAFWALNALAKKDGTMQVRALQAIGTAQVKKGHATYDGFEEDLNGAAHVFAQHPEGQQVVAEKISYIAASGRLDQAIGMTKEQFTPADIHYIDSVVLVSEQMQSQFMGHDDVQKLHALNTLLREHVFFDALVEDFPLRQAGVSATLDLGITELAPRVLAVDRWDRLDDHILRGLALELPENLKTHLPAKAFAGAEFDALKIKAAFESENPRKAMAALHDLPENDAVLQMAANQALEAGYWDMARDALGDLDEAGGNVVGLKAKKDLASVLSVPSPHLTPVQASQDIGELEALQTFLDKDIEIIKEYVNGG